jgi:hypothetical protein
VFGFLLQNESMLASSSSTQSVTFLRHVTGCLQTHAGKSMLKGEDKVAYQRDVGTPVKHGRPKMEDELKSKSVVAIREYNPPHGNRFFRLLNEAGSNSRNDEDTRVLVSVP